MNLNRGQNMQTKLTADKMKIGKPYTVKALSCTGELRRRIIDMGITPGAKIIMKRIAPFGDPIEYNVRGYALSMRKSEASHIILDEVTK